MLQGGGLKADGLAVDPHRQGYRHLHLDRDRERDRELAGRVRRGQYAQPVHPLDCRFPLPHHRTGAAADPPRAAKSRRRRHLAGHPVARSVLPAQPAVGILAALSDPTFLRRNMNGITIELRVQPRARRTALEAAGGALRASVTAPPEDGKANDAGIALLSQEWR